LTKQQLTLDGQRVTHEQNQLLKALQEGLGGIRDVLIDGTQETYIRVFRDADVPLRRSSANIAIIGGAPRYVVEALGMLLIGTMAYAMAGRPGGMQAAVPVLGALALGAQRILPLLQQVYHSLTSLRGGKALLSDALELLAQPMPAKTPAFAAAPLPFRRSITLNQLHFRYGKELPCILNGVDLEIPRGCRLGLVGTTGSGKSTLLDILMGLIPPTDGTLAVDGVVIDETNQRAWQARIAHVPQSIYLADSSIAENIAFGIPQEEIDFARVREAAARAQIAASIESWKDGYDTFVGERGVRLSGGQRQRIGIARALYKNAEVIIFDEATSALDGGTEDALMTAIDGLDKDLTLVMVAHRLTTLRGCDRIIKMSDGRIDLAENYQQLVGA
jgi:ATP-binding cassette subfamily B protein